MYHLPACVLALAHSWQVCVGAMGTLWLHWQETLAQPSSQGDSRDEAGGGGGAVHQEADTTAILDKCGSGGGRECVFTKIC
jgi:hypothetical protein